jgi:hypothetical protein
MRFCYCIDTVCVTGVREARSWGVGGGVETVCCESTDRVNNVTGCSSSHYRV